MHFACGTVWVRPTTDSTIGRSQMFATKHRREGIVRGIAPREKKEHRPDATNKKKVVKKKSVIWRSKA